LIDAALIIGGSSNLNAYKTIISDYFKESMIIAPADCQWSAAEGSALSQYIIGNYKLSDNLCLLLSNDYSFNIFTKHNDGIGTKIDNLSFSLTNDDQNANFIFTNGAGNHIYNTLTIPVKGFYKEALLFSAEITNDQIASINVTNGNYPNKKFTCEITKLPFYYKIDE
jgi:hypothetical protein